MKQTGTITLDAGVHNADILRYYLGEFRLGVRRERACTRRSASNTGSAGPGGFYARWSADFPDTIEPTGEDAIYAHISFENGAIGQWIVRSRRPRPAAAGRTGLRLEGLAGAAPATATAGRSSCTLTTAR